VTSKVLSFWARFGVAIATFFRILTDGRFAADMQGQPLSETAAEPPAPAPVEPGPVLAADNSAALVLLSLFQGEGRFIDFVQQELVGFDDAEIGAVARVVHAGCRKVLAEHVGLATVRGEAEGSSVTLEPGFDAARVKLTGNVGGSGALTGVLRHRGWLASSMSLPSLSEGASARVLCPAEIEL
jgi:hypothetical protein